MRELVEGTVALIYAVRIADPAQWALRLVCVLGLSGAALACLGWFPVIIGPALLALVAGAALWSVVRPGSPAPMFGIAVVVLWWLAGAEGARWWQTATVAGLLAVFHLGCAYAAAAPSYSAVTGRAARRMLRLGAGYLAACAAGVTLVLAVSAVPADVVPRGLLWVALGTAAVVAAGVVAVGHRRAG